MAKKKDATATIETPQVERRRFQIHRKIIYDLIFRQAGSLSKAVLEGVMNSVDAKAKTCRVSLTPTHVTIEDDGKGFESAEQIHEWFEVLGQPHDASEGKRFGQFRIGRGQLFAYGRNVWETREHAMLVDAKGDGDAYDLVTLPHPQYQAYDGCRITIELYERLLPSGFAQIEAEVRKFVRWLDVAVTVNDVPVSTDPKTAKWTCETDDAWFRFAETGSLAVYNHGVFVADLPASRYGIGGVVVSKSSLQLNTARDQVQSQCPLWRRIVKTIEEHGVKERRTKTTLTDAECEHMLSQLAGRLYKSDVRSVADPGAWWDKPIFPLVTGRRVALRKLSQTMASTVAPAGSVKGEAIHKRKLATVFADSLLESLRVGTLAEASELLESQYGHWDKKYRFPLTVISFAELQEQIDDNFELIDEKDWQPHERIWMRLAAEAKQAFGSVFSHRPDDEDDEEPTHVVWKASRAIRVGHGPAESWTDSLTYIAVSREWLAERRSFELRELADFAALLLHEYCHRDPSCKTHDHDQAFYERYHDATVDFLPTMLYAMFQFLPQALQTENRRLTKKQLEERDRADRATQSAGKNRELTTT